MSAVIDALSVAGIFSSRLTGGVYSCSSSTSIASSSAAASFAVATTLASSPPVEQ